MSNATFALTVAVIMSVGVAIGVALAFLDIPSAPFAPTTRQPTPEGAGAIRGEPTPVNLDEIPEESVRALFDDQGYFFGPDQRLAQIAKKHEGGFGGYSFHADDKSHVYVYMLDISDTESAEAAFREAYNGMHTVTRITPMQGQFRFDQLVEWFPVVDRALLAHDIHPTTGAVLEICNRLLFGLRDASLIVDARRVVGDLGIPQEAVVFKQANPMLLALEDAREPLLRPMVEWVKRLLRSGADDEQSIPYGPGRC
ncbi:MAG: hypothetical protein OXE87_07355 [Chloroflexi bacterium]|nr:hypothetical protein [Chloroflexota bacterium]